MLNRYLKISLPDPYANDYADQRLPERKGIANLLEDTDNNN